MLVVTCDQSMQSYSSFVKLHGRDMPCAQPCVVLFPFLYLQVLRIGKVILGLEMSLLFEWLLISNKTLRQGWAMY